MARENYWTKQEGDHWFVFMNGLRLITEFNTYAEAALYIEECEAHDRQADGPGGLRQQPTQDR
jgi:hypothetical protein